MCEFSIFDYLYRDASNYKAWGHLLLKGTATKDEVEALRNHLNSAEFFIAEQVGIPPLYAALWEYSDGPSEDDHVWHSYHELRPAHADEITGTAWDTVVEVMARFKAVKTWNLTLSLHWDI